MFITRYGKRINNDPSNATVIITAEGKFIPKCFNCNEYRHLLHNYLKKKELKKDNKKEGDKEEGVQLINARMNMGLWDSSLDNDFQFLHRYEGCRY